MPLLSTIGAAPARGFGRGGGGRVYPATSTFALIQTSNISSNTASVSFLDLNLNYTDLYLVAYARTDYNGKSDQLNITFNSDTTASNYTSGYNTSNIIDGQPSSAGRYSRFTNVSGIRVPGIHGNTATASFNGIAEIDFINFSNTSDYKTVIARVGQIDFGAGTCCQNAGTGHAGVTSGSWRSLSAITSITITPTLGTNFVSGSTFGLYGITRNGGYGS